MDFIDYSIDARLKINPATYLGCKNLEGQLYLKGICMNLLKGCNIANAKEIYAKN